MNMSRRGERRRNFNSARSGANIEALRSGGVGAPGRARRAEHASKGGFVYLPGGVARQRVDELNEAREFEARQVGGAMRMNFNIRNGVSGFYRNDRDADLAPLRIGNTDDGASAIAPIWCSTFSISA